MADEARAKGKLRITAGAGEGYEIDPEVAARHSGRPVRDALMSIVQAEVHDPELRQMLTEPRLALDLFGTDEDGQPQELPLSPTEQWDRVLKQLQEADVEVGIARSHAGGGQPCAKRGGPKSDLRARFPRQRVVAHPADYRLTGAERADVRSGQAVFFSGEALAKVECLCRELGGREALWYYAAASKDPAVIREIIVPEQSGSGGHCRAEGSEVLRAARGARRRGLTVVAAGHSHGWLGVFSSGTDWEQMAELARERVARISALPKAAKGQVRQAGRGHNAASVFEVSFPGGPPMGVRITLGGEERPEIRADQLAVECGQVRRRAMSWFSTHNHRGRHMVPMLETISCPHCGSKQQRYVDPSEVVVHVIGPVTLSPQAADALCKEVRAKVKVYSWWASGGGWAGGEPSGGPAGQTPGRTTAAACGVSGAETDASKEPSPFDVCRGGRLIATIPAATLERAAAETPSLGIALGWAPAGAETDRQVGRANG